MTEGDPFLAALYRRVLVGREHDLALVSFDVAVLDCYRGQPSYSLIRTDTAGRLKRKGGWSLDLGIGPGDRYVQCCLRDLAALPEEERLHWALHAALLEGSRRFVQMVLHPGPCIDDGEVRAWE